MGEFLIATSDLSWIQLLDFAKKEKRKRKKMVTKWVLVPRVLEKSFQSY
jgi:hypothetical protein